MNNSVANMKKLGEWIRDNRKLKGMTLEALASHAGMSKQYLSMIERAVGQPGSGNPVVPSREIIKNICKALDVSPAEPFRLAGHAMGGEEEYDLPQGIVVSFLEQSRLTDEQRARIIDHINLIVQGIVSEEMQKWLQNAPQYQLRDRT